MGQETGTEVSHGSTGYLGFIIAFSLFLCICEISLSIYILGLHLPSLHHGPPSQMATTTLPLTTPILMHPHVPGTQIRKASGAFPRFQVQFSAPDVFYLISLHSHPTGR